MRNILIGATLGLLIGGVTAQNAYTLRIDDSPPESEMYRQWITRDGCEPVWRFDGKSSGYYRCPRFHL